MTIATLPLTFVGAGGADPSETGSPPPPHAVATSAIIAAPATSSNRRLCHPFMSLLISIDPVQRGSDEHRGPPTPVEVTRTQRSWRHHRHTCPRDRPR